MHGYVGDASKILALATHRYQMRRVPAGREQLFLAKVAEQPIGAMRIASSSVVRADATQTRFQVLMELNRIGTRYGLSREFQRIFRESAELASSKATEEAASKPSASSRQ